MRGLTSQERELLIRISRHNSCMMPHGRDYKEYEMVCRFWFWGWIYPTSMPDDHVLASGVPTSLYQHWVVTSRGLVALELDQLVRRMNSPPGPSI